MAVLRDCLTCLCFSCHANGAHLRVRLAWGKTLGRLELREESAAPLLHLVSAIRAVLKNGRKFVGCVW